ncbi:hypothetical protein D0859_00041 [Hortaea werneckii]|uniref:BZIP domain-containing protein n=1 Tax=Hortaea werneckii TaxID=91943 RepID=A0A3M7JEI8_HORWE|nr:hypothetical protein D0859_00041 [Hortaea werneckii]
MTVTEEVPHSPNSNLPPLSYNDPAFEPQVGFEFEEPDDESFLRQATYSSPFHLSSIQTDRGIVRGGSQDDNLSIYGDCVALKSSPDESTIAEEADPLLLSAPCHGGLTEPDDAKGAKTTAIQRHARSKKARDALLCEAILDPLVDVNNVKNTKVQCEMYRNQNRLAAVRCRAKKRLNVGRLEERHHVLSANSSYMKREELRLRNQLTQLRTMALRHDTDLCSCWNIHVYNRHQANKLEPAKITAVRPGADIQRIVTGHFSTTRRVGTLGSQTPRTVNVPSRPQSFAAPSECVLARVKTLGTMQDTRQSQAPANDESHPPSAT